MGVAVHPVGPIRGMAVGTAHHRGVVPDGVSRLVGSHVREQALARVGVPFPDRVAAGDVLIRGVATV